VHSLYVFEFEIISQVIYSASWFNVRPHVCILDWCLWRVDDDDDDVCNNS